MGHFSHCFQEEKKQPYWEGALTLSPFLCVTSSFLAPGAQQPGLAQ